MRYYYPKWGRIFLAPEAGGGSGGSSGNPAASQAGGKPTEGSDPNAIVDPYAGLNLDDFDPEVAKVIKAGKEQFASLQEKLKVDAAAKDKAELEARKFQSNYDQLQQQLQKLNGGKGPQGADPKAEQLAKFQEILVNRGVAAPQAKVQAEIMLEMMTDFGTQIKNDIGQNLVPFANTLLVRDAEMSWHTAMQQDKIGALQIPSVQQIVWGQIQEMVKQGQQVTPPVIKNLASMAYVNFLETPEGQQQQQQQQQMSSQPPQFGRMMTPGGGVSPFRPTVADPNAPKYQLNADTEAALQTVLKKWKTDKVNPPGLKLNK